MTIAKNTINENKTQQEIVHSRRFQGIARTYGDAGFAKIVAARIMVIGLGGVGSWVVESLARSGVAALSIMDLDVVAESNINRQILALSETVGRDKVRVLQERVLQINPSCDVEAVDDFLRVENIEQYIHSEFDFVVDCVDDFRVKAALIAYCKRNKIRIITVGGAGGRVEPSKIRQSDLSQTEHDVLLSRTRKQLRQQYGFSLNVKKRFSIPCVYSAEQLRYPDGQGGIMASKPVSTAGGNGLNCAGGLGSITHVTCAFAMHASAYVLNQIAIVAREQK